MNFIVIESPRLKHECSEQVLDGQLDDFPVGTIVRCTECGQYWKATRTITHTHHDADRETTRKVPQWRKLRWRTAKCRLTEWL